ncbi:oxidative damage protection protein [Plasticicumulans sp.]|uniref:oxidative damage protection protein n=1 Tax=Plasticicumulans sp. TaxID=2307179 RepID=UPI000FA71E55|nr:oxidative damage protection protein [Plasticicumulans sp.]MBS0600652.1 oxidative damage protection protein [Pseudomonadota bacterium]RTL06158.1 MAG: oxidative damage protection protein [Xanthomonadales bacterium]HMV39557.1 oxidative damage protection protein [Plasticicumulans sp.]HMW31161.1 oxidative damage protection protein [Plasticicumulans sp.]HMZ11910.1 oxidative damage protection protein [Plasticicumulans sp.]
MSRMVHCVKLGQEAEGLDRQPYPGALGKRIFEQVSKTAWQQWLRHQTMLINEYRLTPIEPKARKFLEEEMEKYFFGTGSTAPQGYVPPKS